jgi:hypothetical protein
MCPPPHTMALTSFMSQMIASKPGCSPKMTIICDNARMLPGREAPRKRRPAYLRSQSIPDFSPGTRSSRWQSLTTSNDLPKQEPDQGISLTIPRRSPSLTSEDYSSMMLDDDISPRFSLRKSKADSLIFLVGL